MNKYFEDLKQHYPKTAKALGITADMTHGEFCERSRQKILREIMEPPRISIGSSTTPLPLSEPIWYTNSTKE